MAQFVYPPAATILVGNQTYVMPKGQPTAAGTPGIGFFGDVQTGFGQDAASQIQVLIGGGISFTFNANGFQFNIVSPLILDRNANGLLAFGTTAAAVDYLQITNGATGSPGVVTVGTVGTDTNIDLEFVPKSGIVVVPTGSAGAGTPGLGGTGGNRLTGLQWPAAATLAVLLGGSERYRFRGTGFQFSNGVNQALLDPNANYFMDFVVGAPNATNWIRITNQPSGTGPSISAVGTVDADIDVPLIPKGNGLVRFGAFTALAAPPIVGYISAKDAGGTTRRLAVV